jgi:hypothetical protein
LIAPAARYDAHVALRRITLGGDTEGVRAALYDRYRRLVRELELAGAAIAVDDDEVPDGFLLVLAPNGVPSCFPIATLPSRPPLIAPLPSALLGAAGEQNHVRVVG